MATRKLTKQVMVERSTLLKKYTSQDQQDILLAIWAKERAGKQTKESAQAQIERFIKKWDAEPSVETKPLVKRVSNRIKLKIFNPDNL